MRRKQGEKKKWGMRLLVEYMLVKSRKSRIHFQADPPDQIKFRDNERRAKREFFSFSCLSPCSLCLTDVSAVVNTPPSSSPDGVKEIRCSLGQRRPHFYMWTAVNTAEWHTTKVGCAAALSLLNGTLAFSFTHVSGTHTSQVFAPKMCGSVCGHIRAEAFLSAPRNRK